MPEANPKAARAVTDGKAPLDYLEPICDAGEARVLAGGAAKYGRRNFRDPGTEMLWSTYLGSMRRHLNALHAGEDIDPDSGEHHLSHIRANTAVLLAAMDAGTLRDDRLDTTVTSRSDAVHKDGNQDAKADTWSASAVEPFVVDTETVGIIDKFEVPTGLKCCLNKGKGDSTVAITGYCIRYCAGADFDGPVIA